MGEIASSHSQHFNICVSPPSFMHHTSPSLYLYKVSHSVSFFLFISHTPSLKHGVVLQLDQCVEFSSLLLTNTFDFLNIA